MEYREIFLKNGIPYDDIDNELIELLYILNFKLELKTVSCCFGHDLKNGINVMFDEEVDDFDIMDMVEYLEDKMLVDFKKWVRNGRYILVNWYIDDLGVRFDNLEEFNEYKLKYVNDLVFNLKNYAIERRNNFQTIDYHEE